MGWKLARIDLDGKKQLKPNEERDIEIKLRPETRAAIHGIVKFPNGMPVCGAVVKLFEKCGNDHCDLKPITFAFTDECGQFLFGVPSGVDFVIKVFFFVPEDKDCDKHDR